MIAKQTLCMGGDPHVPLVIHHQMVDLLLPETIGFELNKAVFFLII